MIKISDVLLINQSSKYIDKRFLQVYAQTMKKNE